ncbi:MAG TPA: head GIN domain-containing protein [Acidimicrobiia bacterium]|jgi:hypothetical protein
MTISIAAATLVLAACSELVGSGNVVTKEVPVDDFTRLDVSAAFDVTVSVGETPKLTIRVDDNVEPRLDVGVFGDTLRIGLKSPLGALNATLEADVVVTSLEEIHGSGAVNLALADTISGDSLDVRLSGASDTEGEVEVDTLNVELSGASNVDLTGTAGQVTADGSGASDVDLSGLEAEDVVIELSGASSGSVNVTGTLAAGASGASNLRYAGSPEVTRSDTSGASSIEPVG